MRKTGSTDQEGKRNNFEISFKSKFLSLKIYFKYKKKTLFPATFILETFEPKIFIPDILG